MRRYRSNIADLQRAEVCSRNRNLGQGRWGVGRRELNRSLVLVVLVLVAGAIEDEGDDEDE
jgi:hypothetical protein